MKKIIFTFLLLFCVISAPTMAKNDTNTILQPETASITLETSFDFSEAGCVLDVEEYRVNCYLLGEGVAHYLKKYTDMPRRERREAAKLTKSMCRFIKDILD